jgi:HSP20 family protein
MFVRPFNWNEMDRLKREVDRLFESTLPRARRVRAGEFPAINVWANESEGIVITAEVAGVEPDAIHISVTGDTLTIQGKRQAETAPESAIFHRRERSFGEFSRTFQLPFAVNRDEVDAVVQNGVLKIDLPRAEAEKPRQITVKAG